MLTLQSIYEKDRERLIARISGQDRETVIREVQAEFDRLLMTFNDQEPEEQIRESTSRMLQTARSAAGFLDTEGATKIYGKTEYQTEKSTKKEHAKKPIRFWIYLIAGIVLAVGVLLTTFLQIDSSKANVAQQILLLAGAVLSGLLLFLSGRSLHNAPPGKKEELYTETSLDAAKVSHQLLSIILTMDKNIDDLRTALKIREHQERIEAGAQADPAELELMAQLLEDAYGRREEDEQAEELCVQLKYYLHQKHIDVVDYEPDGKTRSGKMKKDAKESGRDGRSAGGDEKAARREWFDMIPAYAGGTIRPALVMEGVLLKKGLASNG